MRDGRQLLVDTDAFLPALTLQVMQRIKDIEDEMARTQKNKATMSHLGMLKAKLAKLRREILEPAGGGGGGGKGEGFDVNKVGDARVGFVGFPSVGKSDPLEQLHLLCFLK